MAILDLLKTGEDPHYPGLVLTVHVIAKGVEMGAVLGLALGVLGGVGDVIFKKKHPLSRVLRLCEMGVSLGALFGFVSTFYKAEFDSTMNVDGIQDRAYRLVHSEPGIKHKMDVRFLTGGIVGALATVFIIPEDWFDMDVLDKLARGFCLGGALSIVDIALKIANKMATKKLEMR